MLVKEVMLPEIEGIAADAPLSEAINKFGLDGGVLAVFDADQLQGSLSEHDLALWQAAPDHDPKAARVRDVLRPHTYLSEEQDVREAAKLMKDEHAGGLVVVKGKQPVGMVSLAEVATRISTPARAGDPLPAAISLQPIAAPSILGFCGLAGALLIVGGHMAGWYGGSTAPEYLFPFVALFGGLAQFLAGMWAYRARDGVATVVHGMWGSFWLAYGLLYLLVANGTLAATLVNQTFGFWFIPLAAVSFVGMIAAFADNAALGGMLAALTAASVCAAISLLIGDNNWIKVTGWLFMVSALAAWYLASALLLEGAYRRVILPLGRTIRGANRPGSIAMRPVEYPLGEPGVRVGQ